MEDDNLSSGQKGSFTRLRKKITSDFDELLKDIESKRDDIEGMKNLLLIDDDEGESLQTQMIQARDEASEKLEKITELFEQVEIKHDLVLAPVDGLYNEIETTHQNITQTYDECLSLMKKFKKSSDILYGDEDDGLENDLEELALTYKESLNSNKSKADELLLQIEGALSGATNVELAKAFQDQKNSYKNPKYGWAALFITSILSMIYLGIDAKGISSEGTEYLYDLGKRLTIFGPLVWLALFSSKQQAQNKRLEEEYSHKEAVTKTYVGHKRQIEKLGDSEAKDELLIQLAKTTIQTIDFNPSSTLEKQNPKSDLPASELLDLLKKAVDKVGK